MVNAITNGLSSMGSYLWGSNTTNTVTVGEKMGEENAPDIKAEDIVKEGYLFKQSRHLKQWKR